MKTFKNILTIVFFGVLSLNNHCLGHSDDDEVEVDELQETLDFFQKKDWKITSVFKDGGNITQFWGTNFVVNFGEGMPDTDHVDEDNPPVGSLYGVFTSSGQDEELVPEAFYVWPETGSWGAMKKDDNGVITFTRFADPTVWVADKQVITIEEVTATTLKLSFTVADPNARSKGIYDELWEFEFSN